MAIKLSHCFLYVSDQDEALRFFTDGVGLDVRTDARMGDFRWLTVGPATQPDIELGLMTIGPPLPPEDFSTVRDLVAKGSMGSVIFAVEDCQASFERLSSFGAEVLQKPTDQPYGVIDCAFRDPSGNMVRFSQNASAKPR